MPITIFCPFFISEKKGSYSCEGCHIKFFDKEARRDYLDINCASLGGWKSCTIAQNLMKYYDRKENMQTKIEKLNARKLEVHSKPDTNYGSTVQ